MMNEYLNKNDINHSEISSLIPLVMNALYNDEASKNITFNEIRDAFRLKQIQSKAWLIDHFKKNVNDASSKILVIGSWIGFTSLCLYHSGYSNILEVDPDFRLEDFSKHLNRFNSNFHHSSIDVNNLKEFNFDVIVNTSCEHIKNNHWFDSINKESLLILQSNDLEGYDHTNICKDIEDMKQKYPMELLYSGTLDFDSYKRFMLVGKKK